MARRKITKQLVAGADALSVVCDQLDEVSTPSVARNAAKLAARTYRRAAEMLESAEGIDAARDAYANAAFHYERAGAEADASLMTKKAMQDLNVPMRLSLNGVAVGIELPGGGKR